MRYCITYSSEKKKAGKAWVVRDIFLELVTRSWNMAGCETGEG